MKKRTSLWIDSKLLEKAKEKKINLSQLLEKAIKMALNGKICGMSRSLGSRPVGVRGFKSLPPHRIPF
ncbi:type II toxin-antitoxin system CcdA family antitoxin [Archaeoglobus sp.]